MADKRAYAKFDVGYMDNPKVSAVFDESPLAVLLHMRSIMYAAQHLTDGVVPRRTVMRMVGAEPADATLLIKHGLWEDRGADVVVHDYLEHQRSSAEAKGAAAKAKKAADARWSAEPDAPTTGPSDASSMPSSIPNRMPIEREEREREKKESAPSRRKPNRPIPDDWQPNDKHVETARTRGIEAAVEAEKMRNWALSKDERRADWDRTFTNWLTNARVTPQNAAAQPTAGTGFWDRVVRAPREEDQP